LQNQPDTGDPSDGLVGSIAQAATYLLPRIDEELRSVHGLSLSDFAVLRILFERRKERLTMSDLARAVGISPAGVTRVMQRLSAHGLVHREHGATDRRPLFATLTQAGQERLTAAAPTYARAVRSHLTRHAQNGELEAARGFLQRALLADAE
jgi:DNA-binding MarR family transcriptional regulator